MLAPPSLGSANKERAFDDLDKKESLCGSMSKIDSTSVDRKLSLGLGRLEKAGSDPERLGPALTAIHGALEDHLRLWVAGHPHVSEASRIEALDRGAFTWRDLLRHLGEYAPPETHVCELLELVPSFNRMRQEVAHGGAFSGTQETLTRYSEAVTHVIRQGIGKTESQKGAASGSREQARERDPIAFERLREQRIARLDREWRMARENFTVPTQGGRRCIPGKWTRLAAWLACLPIALVLGAVLAATGELTVLFFLAPLLFCGLFNLYAFKKALRHNRARSDYEAQRRLLLGEGGL